MEISDQDITLVKRHLFIIYPWGLLKKPKNRFLPIFSPDFTLNSQIWLFYAEKWIFLKNLVLCLKSFSSCISKAQKTIVAFAYNQPPPNYFATCFYT